MRSFRQLLLLGSFALTLALAGCGGPANESDVKDGGPPPANAPKTQEEYYKQQQELNKGGGGAAAKGSTAK